MTNSRKKQAYYTTQVTVKGLKLQDSIEINSIRKIFP